jgi:hypothetical protein
VGMSLLGGRAVMSGLAIVVDAQVSIVTRYAFSPVHSSVCRLSLLSLSNALSV